jgi:hypothetical protein
VVHSSGIDATDISTGRVSIRLASYTIERGTTRSSVPVLFVSPLVSTQALVASDPAYVVGTGMMGKARVLAGQPKD